MTKKLIVLYVFLLLLMNANAYAEETIVCKINALGYGVKNGDIKINCNTNKIGITSFNIMYSNGWKLIGTSNNILFFLKD